jgi:hypothetical protein
LLIIRLSMTKPWENKKWNRRKIRKFSGIFHVVLGKFFLLFVLKKFMIAFSFAIGQVGLLCGSLNTKYLMWHEFKTSQKILTQDCSVHHLFFLFKLFACQKSIQIQSSVSVFSILFGRLSVKFTVDLKKSIFHRTNGNVDTYLNDSITIVENCWKVRKFLISRKCLMG